MSSVAFAATNQPALHRERIAQWLDRILIYGSIVLIPYDLPVLHQACVPLACIAMALMILRWDMWEFLGFVRQFSAPLLCVLLVAGCALASVYVNVGMILSSSFQDETGWLRAVLQTTLLLITLWYPFYLSFCISRHRNWPAMIRRAAWLSLPVPLFVGAVQIANMAGVPGLSHLPYVGAYKGGFFRITSVARESSWFGSFACVVLPFLIYDIATRLEGLRKWIGIGAVALTLFIFILGFSKSAYAAVALEGGLGLILTFFICRPWRRLKIAAFGLLLTSVLMFVTAVLAPSVFDRLTRPFISVATTTYQLFEPLILGDTKFISIGTRFGMSEAGTAMGEAHPVFGVGLGQFGFHVQTFLPVWGLNEETEGWLSNDTGEWPSTSNLYTRLFGEIGLLGASAYIAFRALITLWLTARFFRTTGNRKEIDALIICSLAALVAFDFHRDSFINLDIWVVLSMAMASIASPPPRPAAQNGVPRIFGFATAAGFVIAIACIVMEPATYHANALVLAKPVGVEVRAASPPGGQGFPIINDAADVPLSVAPSGISSQHFAMFQTFWGSRLVAGRLIVDYPDLVKAVLGTPAPVDSVALAEYVNIHLPIVTADKKNLVSLGYDNRDPDLALRFLTAVISETDRAVDALAMMSARQAAETAQLANDGTLDDDTRQNLLRQAAARELQSAFDLLGRNGSFDYIERPAVSATTQRHVPAALALALVLGLLTGATVSAGYSLWKGAPR